MTTLTTNQTAEIKSVDLDTLQLYYVAIPDESCPLGWDVAFDADNYQDCLEWAKTNGYAVDKTSDPATTFNTDPRFDGKTVSQIISEYGSIEAAVNAGYDPFADEYAA